ncbi:sulfurtransferase-like selenium metabolism protein YedF [Vagococcus hydrophili]|uniref:Sulfurtransferase-like selenium metabolism protein YedF n=1 Tax=Vagococcus hydrophili TaxID=2714947 RepID=A0A6G8AUP7_9ENTE|nr:sulfurtransferase-like selenium metabolism protein YedF [Vagococcus hydrophili]QIL48784.1 sulfurtransferase-like selenium metabolism protein YedF [Vagococcus hydrophili]
MFEIDAKGMACPLPVIKTKKALKENKEVTTIVDNEIATQNLKKLAEQLQLNYQVEKISDSHYITVISHDEITNNIDSTYSGENTVAVLPEKLGYTVVLDTNIMGRGSDELGANLMKAFVYSLLEQDELPETIICYNSGVKLTVEGSDCLEDLLQMKEQGVAFYSCGACLNYYELTEKLAVGEVTNMYRIVEMMQSAVKIVKP